MEATSQYVKPKGFTKDSKKKGGIERRKNMVHNRRTALKAAAALAAAAEIAAPGTVDAAPVNPMLEKFPAPLRSSRK